MWLEVLKNRNGSVIENLIVWAAFAEALLGAALVFYLLNHNLGLFGYKFLSLMCRGICLWNLTQVR